MEKEIPLCSVAQFCPTFCDPIDYSAPGSSVHGILQARILEQVAILYSKRYTTNVNQKECLDKYSNLDKYNNFRQRTFVNRENIRDKKIWHNNKYVNILITLKV